MPLEPIKLQEFDPCRRIPPTVGAHRAACRPVYYADLMHYSDVSRARTAQGRLLAILALFVHVRGRSLCLQFCPWYRSRILQHRAWFYKPAGQWLPTRAARNYGAIFLAHARPETNSACSTNHIAELPVAYRAECSRSPRWHFRSIRSGSWLRMCFNQAGGTYVSAEHQPRAKVIEMVCWLMAIARGMVIICADPDRPYKET